MSVEIGDLLWPGLTAAVVSAAACGGVWAAGITDAPDDVRKAHINPTPTSGGVGVAIGVSAGLILVGSMAPAGWLEALAPEAVWGMAAAAGLALTSLLIGLYDDVRPLGPKLKFGVFALLALAAPLLVGHAEALPIGAGLTVHLGLVVGVLGSALWVFTLVNTVNFVDGANGLAMGSAGIGLAGLGMVSLIIGAPHAAILAFCGVGAIAGFLVWNFPAGRLFAGDAGALSVGMLAACVALLAIHDGGLSPFIPPILFFPLLADVLLTLAWRTRHRTRILDGHRDHLYQIGMRAGLKHWQAALVYWALMLKCLVIACVLAYTMRIAPPQDIWRLTADADVWRRGVAVGAGALASLATTIAFVTLALISMKISNVVRRFAKARGLDAP